MKSTIIQHALRAAFGGGATLLAVTSLPLHAQEAPQAQAAAPADVVVVTGTATKRSKVKAS
jgi:hypothetical protein